ALVWGCGGQDSDQLHKVDDRASTRGSRIAGGDLHREVLARRYPATDDQPGAAGSGLRPGLHSEHSTKSGWLDGDVKLHGLRRAKCFARDVPVRRVINVPS